MGCLLRSTILMDGAISDFLPGMARFGVLFDIQILLTLKQAHSRPGERFLGEVLTSGPQK